MKVWADRRKRLEDRGRRAAVSLLIGMAFAALSAGSVGTNVQEPVRRMVKNEGQQLLTWWGTLYPQFCFAGKEEGQEVRVTFWLAKLLNA